MLPGKVGCKKTWLWLIWGIAVAIKGAPQECVFKHKAQLVALLALRSGDSCQHVIERGLQQEAALHFINDQLNSENPQRPQIELKVHDTCSTSEQAVSAVLQALVRAKQGCSGPMFLGFIGPEDPEALQAVARVITVFDYPHIALQAVRTYSQYNTFEIETVDASVTASGIGMFLDELNWASFYMTFTSDEISSQTVSSLLEKTKYCVLDATIHIPTSAEHTGTDSYARLTNALQKGEDNKVLIVAEKPESVEALLTALDRVSNKTNVVIYLRSTGILPWKLTGSNFKSVVILQETSKSTILPSSFREEVEKSPLWPIYGSETNCSVECGKKLLRDASTTNLAYAMHLFHDALHSAIDSRCHNPNDICPVLVQSSSSTKDWRNRLEKQTHFYTVPGTKEQHKIKFHTFLPRHVAILAKRGKDFESVGEIINGESLVLEKNSQLPVTQTGRIEQCQAAKSVLPTAPPSTTSEPTASVKTTGLPIVIDVLGLDVKLGDFGYYELVGIISGVAFGMVLLIVAMTIIVYRCFRVKSNNTFSSPSSTSVVTPKKKTRFDTGRLLRTFSGRSEHTVRE